jgi:hypothetical protein
MPDGLGLVAMASVPGYFILQGWVAYTWAGGWRIASLAPLIAIGPAVAFSFYALAHGSNLWPLTVVLLSPVCLVYLLILGAIRALCIRRSV